MEMDVVIYAEKDDEHSTKRIGAIQEDGRLTPLSAWTEDAAFGEFIELVVDEHDLFPGFREEDQKIIIHTIVAEQDLSYGSRQVGGGKGPGNPHGEESELLFYVSRQVLEGVELIVKPELEITW
jgi:hypothetical protein